MDKIANELVKIAKELTSAKVFNADSALDVIEAEFKRRATMFSIENIYSQNGANGKGIHMRIGDGHYSVWTEDDDGEVALSATCTGEGAKEIDEAFYDAIQNWNVEDEADLKKQLKHFFDRLEDAQDEVRQRNEKEEE